VVPITNGTPATARAVLGTSVLQGLACPNVTTCAAVGVKVINYVPNGVVVPISEGAPSASQAVSGTRKLYGVACSSAVTCEAVGFNSAVQGVVVMVASAPAAPRDLGRPTGDVPVNLGGD
jgi:hypothetical protein